MVVFAVGLKVPDEALDFLGENGDLHARRARVAIVDAVFVNDFLFYFRCKHWHYTITLFAFLQVFQTDGIFPIFSDIQRRGTMEV